MSPLLRRLVCVAAIGATAALVARWWAVRSVPAPTAPPQWPAFADEGTAAADGYRAATAPTRPSSTSPQGEPR